MEPVICPEDVALLLLELKILVTLEQLSKLLVLVLRPNSVLMLHPALAECTLLDTEGTCALDGVGKAVSGIMHIVWILWICSLNVWNLCDTTCSLLPTALLQGP